MKVVQKLLAVGVAFLALSACAEQDNWQPTVDTAYDPRPGALGTDMEDCRELASQAADQDQTVGEDAGVGALGGAALGAILGAITGGPATGAAIGAVTGTGFGIGTGASNTDATFRQAYANCLRQRGHAVIN